MSTRASAALLPKTDAFHATDRDMPLITKMIAEGYTGRKGKGGFYRIDKDRRRKQKQAIDLDDRRLPRRRASRRLPELTGAGEGPARADVDRQQASATTPGASWPARWPMPRAWCPRPPTTSPPSMRPCGSATTGSSGPFELIDKLGAGLARRARSTADGIAGAAAAGEGSEDKTFYRVENGKRQYLRPRRRLPRLVRARRACCCWRTSSAPPKPLLKNGSAALWDIGDGVACLEFTCKMQCARRPDHRAARQGRSTLVQEGATRPWSSTTRASNFSVGANLGLALFAANIAAWGEIERLIAAGPEDATRR